MQAFTAVNREITAGKETRLGKGGGTQIRKYMSHHHTAPREGWPLSVPFRYLGRRYSLFAVYFFVYIVAGRGVGSCIPGRPNFCSCFSNFNLWGILWYFVFSTLEKTNGHWHVLLTQQESTVRALAFDVSVSFHLKPTLLSFHVITRA
jgi:hypothetical protein